MPKKKEKGHYVYSGPLDRTIKKKVIPAWATKLDDWSFHECFNLTEITIPNTVKIIGEGAFSDCPNLKTVTLPSTVELIKTFAFHKCGLETVFFVDSDDLTKTEKRNAGKDLQIQISAFSDNPNLTEVVLPKHTRFIDSSAFRNTGMTKFRIPIGCTFNKYVFHRCKLTELEVPISGFYYNTELNLQRFNYHDKLAGTSNFNISEIFSQAHKIEKVTFYGNVVNLDRTRRFLEAWKKFTTVKEYIFELSLTLNYFELFRKQLEAFPDPPPGQQKFTVKLNRNEHEILSSRVIKKNALQDEKNYLAEVQFAMMASEFNINGVIRNHITSYLTYSDIKNGARPVQQPPSAGGAKP